MAVKTIFSSSDLVTILSDYDLGEYVGSKPFTQGTVQTNLLIQTTRGQFAFRYYENRTVDSVCFEIELLKYLQTRNYPCPAPIQNREGHAVGMYANKPYAMFHYMDGHHVENPNVIQQGELIRHIAELHLLTSQYEPHHLEARSNYNVQFCRNQAEIEAEKINTIHAKWKLQWLNTELDQLILPVSLPMGVCHCDFHFSNLLFHQNKLTAVLDFDDANYTFLLFDVVNLIDYRSWPHNGKLDFHVARDIVQQYRRYRNLETDEKWHLYDVYKLQVLMDSIWFMSRGEAPDFYEKNKIDALNELGREHFYDQLFA
jgi:homoserine kinase type II